VDARDKPGQMESKHGPCTSCSPAHNCGCTGGYWTGCDHVDIRQVCKNLFDSFALDQDLHDDRERLWPNLWEIPLRVRDNRKGEFLCRGAKLCGYTWLVASWVYAIPPVLFEIDGIQPMQAAGGFSGLNLKALIAKAGWNGIGPQQRSQEVTFGVAVAGSMDEDVGSLTSHWVGSMVPTVFDFVTDELKATPDNIFIG
jgi:hypothetical protein